LDAFPSIHIPGEEELKTISQEVNHVITHRIKELARKKRFSTQIRSHLEKRLQETTHRTYLWVYLIFDYLENHGFKKIEKGVESAVATLPKGINEAYKQILNKANKDPMVRKVLSIILAASWPLTVSEMNVAVNIDDEFESIDDLDLEDDEDFKTRLRSWCGLFISIHQGSVYFIHQTAREFLLADLVSPTPVSSELHWLHSITTRDAHAVLAKLCVLYLNFFNSNVTLLTDIDGEASYDAGKFPLLDYSAETWGTHFREAGFIDDDSIVPFALKICDTGSKSYSVWFRIYWKTPGKMTTKCFTDLMIGSYYGHYVIVKLLLDKGAEVEAKDSRYGQTPLSLAAENGYEAVVKLLLDKGNARIEDSIGRTSLFFAAKNGHDTVAMALIRHYSINLDQEDDYGSTPLSVAVRNSRTEIVNMLLATGQVFCHSQDRFGRTSWYWARRCRNFEIQQLLLDYAEKRGIAVCENDGEVIEESFISNDGTSIFCDVCTLSIPEDVVFYHCEVCNGGDFDICPGCYQIGGRCLGDGHELAQKNNIKE
jgi:ankyrin repeat protein